jgi:hypothetical protein
MPFYFTTPLIHLFWIGDLVGSKVVNVAVGGSDASGGHLVHVLLLQLLHGNQL